LNLMRWQPRATSEARDMVELSSERETRSEHVCIRGVPGYRKFAEVHQRCCLGAVSTFLISVSLSIAGISCSLPDPYLLLSARSPNSLPTLCLHI
jgi:hypothetical protein